MKSENKKLLLLSDLYFRLFGIPEITQTILFRAVSKLLDINHQHIILDVGCGYGLFSCWLASQGAQVLGLDIAKGKVEFAKSTARNLDIEDKVSYVIASATCLPIKEKSFNASLCLDVIEHIPNDVDALSEISRVLKPKGFLILTTPCLIEKYHSSAHNRFGSAWGHVRDGYSFKALNKICKETCLEILRLQYWLKFFATKVSDFYYNFFWERHSKTRLALCAMLFPFMYAIAFIDEIFLRKSKGNEFIIEAIKFNNCKV